MMRASAASEVRGRQAPPRVFPDARLQALLTPQVGERILREEAGIEWPNECVPADVRIQRAWPGRNGAFTVEWSFSLGDKTHLSVFGRTHQGVVNGVGANEATRRSDEGIGEEGAVGARASFTPVGESNRVVCTPRRLQGLHVNVPEWGMLIHTPDLDPGLAHLGVCLDGAGMADRLKEYWVSVEAFAPAPVDQRRGNGDPDSGGLLHRVTSCECHLLAYRAGRRAAIEYRVDGGNDRSLRLVGKTYRDDRGSALVGLHSEVNAWLLCASRGRVAVPLPVGYARDVKMAFVRWSSGTSEQLPLAKLAVAAADALAVFHDIPLDRLRVFTVADELSIVSLWYDVLRRVDTPNAGNVSPIVAALHEAGGSADARRTCTIHRDCYEKQFVFGGDNTTMLDLDTVARGDPGVDIGNLLAHMMHAALGRESGSATGRRVRVGSFEEFRAAGEALVGRYTGGGGALKRAALAFYWASALFRLGAIHSLRSSGKRHAPMMWSLARAVLLHTAGGTSLRRTACGLDSIDFDPLPILRLVRK
ncbi:MAG: phosphotransferase [Phycisphaerae bacterium]